MAEAAIGQRRHDLIGHRLVQQTRLIGAIHLDPRQIVVATPAPCRNPTPATPVRLPPPAAAVRAELRHRAAGGSTSRRRPACSRPAVSMPGHNGGSRPLPSPASSSGLRISTRARHAFRAGVVQIVPVAPIGQPSATLGGGDGFQFGKQLQLAAITAVRGLWAISAARVIPAPGGARRASRQFPSLGISQDAI